MILRTAILAMWLGFIVAMPAHGLQPDRRISQYGHTAWRVQDGALNGPATMIQQTADGYLWVATRSGLFKFDGIRFQEFAPSQGERLRSPRIVTLLRDSDGSLWIGTGADLEHWKNNELIHYPREVGRAVGTIIDIRQGRDGKIWISRIRAPDERGPICEVTADDLLCHGHADGIGSLYVDGTEELPDHSLLLLVGGAGYQWNPDKAEAAKPLFSISNNVDAFQTMSWSPEGQLLLGSAKVGYGLSTLKDNTLEPFVIPGFDGRKIFATIIFFDSHKVMWVGTQGMGLYRIADGKVDQYQASDGLSGDTIYSIFEDHEGDIWVGTSQGLDRFRDLKVTTYSSRQGFGNDLVNSVTAATDGTIWVSNWHSLEIVAGGNVTSITSRNGLPGDQVTAVYADHTGRVWVGVDDGLTLYSSGKFLPVLDENGHPLGNVTAMIDDRQGNLWVKTRTNRNGKLLRLAAGKLREEVTFDQLPYGASVAMAADMDKGLWLPLKNGDIAHWYDGRADIVGLHRKAGAPPVSSLATLPDGTVYAGSTEGLYGLRNGKVQMLGESGGLPCTNIFSILADADSLWLYSSCGLLSLDASALKRWWSDPSENVPVTKIGPLDGAQPASASWSPRVARSQDGRLWFANASVLQVLDPVHPVNNRLPPPVHIAGIVADRRPYATDTPITVPALTRNLEIDYTALSFAVTEKVEFRYKLTGHDEQWIDAGSRRQAFYTDLTPGTYRFQVIASNNDGVWNTQGASTTLRVLPAFYQQLWFQLLCALSILVSLWMAYLWRVRQLALRVRESVQTRTRERERIARELHDTLLQSMQGLIYTLHAGTQRLSDAEPVKKTFESALNSADQSLLQGREQVQGLRRSMLGADQSLEDALRDLNHQGAQARGCRVTVASSGEREALVDAVAEELYSISLEALNNALRHAEASDVGITVQHGSVELVLEIRDNGRGFATGVMQAARGRNHFGLLGMSERASRIHGELQVESSIGVGTLIRCRVPRRFAYRSPSNSVIVSWFRRTFTTSLGDEIQ